MKQINSVRLILSMLLLAACSPVLAAPTLGAVSTEVPTLTPVLDTVVVNTPQPTATPTPSPTLEEAVVFAVIGDYGQSGRHAFAVAEMIDSWQVDFIITTGDNNYPNGEAETIDENIGQYYHRYIGNYKGEYNLGSEINRFFPSLGNHDWVTEGAEPYLDFFTLPGNERYYDVVWSPVQLFIVDSDPHEPDGVGISSDQAAWLQEELASSEEAWQVVIMHHPPYSSSEHGSTVALQWSYQDWGADVVLAGHDHVYERLEVDGLPYLISGLGGHASRYDFVNILPESKVRYNDTWGALRVTVTSQSMAIEFINIDGLLIDSVVLLEDD
ncbi:MAG: metallophosphoesterase [Anaerolineales bacterium]